MPLQFIVPPDQIDVSHVVMGMEEIRKSIPHRFEMEMLSGILRLDPEHQLAIGYKDVRADEFWCRGHIPGRPLLPGVLMVEAAAQLCTFYYKRVQADSQDKFLGFAALDHVRFRATVVPGDQLILVAKNARLHPRLAIFDCQGIVRERLTFEATITGMVV